MGTEIAVETSGYLNIIVDGINSSSDLIETMIRVSSEQNAEMDDINETLKAVIDTTQHRSQILKNYVNESKALAEQAKVIPCGSGTNANVEVVADSNSEETFVDDESKY
jgi:methyl-accepting chemotaxis protein